MSNETSEAVSEYAAVLRFATEHNGISYARFDDYTQSAVNLFALRDGYDFDFLESTLDKIIAALPALKRLLGKPIMRLEDTSEVLPVESVRVINSRTLRHAAVHSEHWGSVDGDGVRPKKLLTVRHEDSYVTYENIGLARAVYTVLKFVSQCTRHLRDILYTSRDMHFNLLERENHLAYFLAIGKLHIGYVRDYDKYRVLTVRCLEKLFSIERALTPRLRCPVYQKCKPFVSKFELKKSTTFRVHKDYHEVYRLLKCFSDSRLALDVDACEDRAAYSAYATLISLFAIGHFNFAFDKEKPLDFFKLNAKARFGAFQLEIKRLSQGGKDALLFTVKKEGCYRILLALSPDAKEKEGITALFKEKYEAEEYLLATPTGEGGTVCLSLFDIESFRRVQQLLLRASVYADERRDSCPFCGKALAYEKDKARYICESCRTVISSGICEKTGEKYFATSVMGYRPAHSGEKMGKKERLIRDKYVEGRLFFRNITPVNEDGEVLCPHCGARHTDA